MSSPASVSPISPIIISLLTANPISQEALVSLSLPAATIVTTNYSIQIFEEIVLTHKRLLNKLATTILQLEMEIAPCRASIGKKTTIINSMGQTVGEIHALFESQLVFRAEDLNAAGKDEHTKLNERLLKQEEEVRQINNAINKATAHAMYSFLLKQVAAKVQRLDLYIFTMQNIDNS